MLQFYAVGAGSWSYWHCEGVCTYNLRTTVSLGLGFSLSLDVFGLLYVEVRGTRVAVTSLLAPSKLWSLNLPIALGLRCFCKHICGSYIKRSLLSHGSLYQATL